MNTAFDQGRRRSRMRRVFASLIAACASFLSGATTANVEGVLDAAQFDIWLQEQRRASASSAPRFCDEMLARLSESRMVSDGGVLSCVSAWIEYAQPGPSADGDRLALDLPQALGFFDALIPRLDSRPALQGQVLSRRAAFHAAGGRTAEAISDWQAAASLLDSHRLETDELRNGNLVSYADALLSAGDKERAEAIYLEVLSYPWFNANSQPRALHRLRDLYLRAGRGLIACRAGNAQALAEIYFVPSAQAVLGPALDKARAMAEEGDHGRP